MNTPGKAYCIKIFASLIVLKAFIMITVTVCLVIALVGHAAKKIQNYALHVTPTQVSHIFKDLSVQTLALKEPLLMTKLIGVILADHRALHAQEQLLTAILATQILEPSSN